MNKPETTTPAQHKALAPQAFLALGTPSLAYVRPIAVDGKPHYGIFAADGTALGAVPNRDLAFAAARQHDLEPVSIQ